MKNRIRKRLDKKERSAKARAEEKNQKFCYRKMLQEYVSSGGSNLEDLGPEEIEELLVENGYPDSEEAYLEEQEEASCYDPEDLPYDCLTDEEKILFDTDSSDKQDETNDGDEHMDCMPVSLWSFLAMGSLGFLLIVSLTVYAGSQFFHGGKGAQTEQTETETMETKLTETDESETDALWISTIFGTDEPVEGVEVPSVYGLTDKAKKKLQFDEDDFSNAVAIFLNENGIDTELIYLENTIPCSAKSAVGYIASMAGVSDQKLEMIFYPEYPGEYLFILTEKEKVEIPVSGNAKEDKTDLSSAGTAVQETENSQTYNMPQSESMRVIYQTQETDENTYDAGRLSISSIPSELKNYISNEYMLQYQLYDYLYNHGMQKVRSAKVTEYSIDGDVRQATFRLGLDNGQTVVCTFYHDSGSYSFS